MIGDLREDQQYALGLIVEETSEACLLIGKTMRFGFDARGPAGPPYYGSSARELLPIEAGDILAALRYAEMTGVLDMADVERCAKAKLDKLLDPSSLNANGNRLAPAPRGYQA